jgi:uncharacterized membrane protein YdjX (TVP38/TMEM64 family)
VHGIWGELLYLGITIVAVVIAPVSTFALLPMAATMWGSAVTALLSIVGWTIGAVIAFLLARRYGKVFVGKFTTLHKLQEYGEQFSETNLFWSVVFMRMVLPVYVLSYALGLFSNMSPWSYIHATIIGITPFAFIFSYIASLSVGYQIGALTLAGISVILGHRKIKRLKAKKIKGKET